MKVVLPLPSGVISQFSGRAREEVLDELHLPVLRRVLLAVVEDQPGRPALEVLDASRAYAAIWPLRRIWNSSE